MTESEYESESESESESEYESEDEMTNVKEKVITENIHTWHQEIKEIYTTVNGKRDGKYQQWYLTGGIFIDTNYVNGKIHGEYKRWYENGRIDIHTYVRAKEDKVNDTFQIKIPDFEENNHGEYRSRYVDGELVSWATFPEKNWHGEYKKWHKNGKLNIQTNYNNGKLDGKYEEWDENGDLKKETTYINGKEM